jgi:hypothetical protein
MPTEPFEIALAPRRAVRGVSADSQYSICATVIAALRDAGWSDDGGTRAGWSLVFPVGPPWTTEPNPPIPEEDKRVITWGFNPLRIDGFPVCYYDEYRERPDPANPNHVIWVKMGEAPGSLGDLALLLFYLGWVHVGTRVLTDRFFRNWRVYDFEFITEGVDYNDASYGTNSHDFDGGVWTFIWAKGARTLAPRRGPVGGGNWLRSATLNNHWLRVWIGISDITSMATFVIHASPGGEAIRTLWSRKDNPTLAGNYKIFANPYQFVIFLEFINPLGDGRYNQLLVSMPKFDPNKGVQFAAIVAGADTFRRTLQWESGTAAAALNGPLSGALTKPDATFHGTFPGLYMIKYPYPLRGASGGPILQQAFVGAPQELGDGTRQQARIVGRLWDAVIIGETYPLDSTAKWGNRVFQCIGNETIYGGTKASLWMAAEEEGLEG